MQSCMFVDIVEGWPSSLEHDVRTCRIIIINTFRQVVLAVSVVGFTFVHPGVPRICQPETKCSEELILTAL